MAIEINNSECFQYGAYLYDYLCDIAHVSSKGLKNFFTPKGNGYTFCIGRNDLEEIKKLLIAVYEIYLKTLVIFSDNFKTPTKSELETFKDFFIKLGKMIN